MAKDPNLFKPMSKDYGAHNQKYAKKSWEWYSGIGRRGLEIGTGKCR
jgi:hypothetical protein